MSDSIYSRIIFVGREKELAWLTQMMQASLTDSNPQWILSIQASGGMGKTQLLKQFVEMAQKHRDSTNPQNVLITQYPIDLYLTSHQTEPGILRSIAEQLTSASKTNPFAHFFTALDRSFQAVEEEINLRSIFLDCYDTLDAEQVILLFDTTECTNQAIKRFFQEMLPQLGPRKQRKFRPLIVTAGRTPLTDYCHHPQIDCLELQGLSPIEIRQYFEQAPTVQSTYEISPEFVNRIATLSQGRPILVVLTIDWLNNGSKPEDLDADSPEAFEKMMIERISELRYSEDQVILAMAQLKRRFDAGFLAEILGEPVAKASDLIESVSKYSFVKSHYSTDGKRQSCLLHDEMQRLVYTHIWQHDDPNKVLRRAWSAKAVDYYDQLLAVEKDLISRQNLQQEQLYYTLYVDIDQGLDMWRSLLKQANTQAHSKEFKSALNEEVQSFKSELNQDEQGELELEWANLDYGRGRYGEALVSFERIFEKFPSRIIQSRVRPYLVYIYAHLDDFASSISTGQQSETWFRSELKLCHCSLEEYQQLLQNFSQTLNAMGWAYRKKGEFSQAIIYYQESLKVLQQVKKADLERASTKTNLAYVFHIMGKNREAIAHGKTALKIGQRSGDLKQLGRSHSVLGIIAANSLHEQEAIRHFEAALSSFSEIDFTPGLAMVNIAYGRLYRQIGWDKVKPLRTSSNDAQVDYDQAMTMFDHAFEHCQQRQELLAEIYNEKGTLLREQGRFDDAIDFYQKSQSIAEKLDNPIWRIDNLQDIGVAYYLQDKLDQAQAASSQAKNLAEKQLSPHLVSRAQRTLANILFQNGEYEKSLEIALESCINILKLDQYSLNNSPAMRDLLIEEWLAWLTEELLEKIEDVTLRKSQCHYLIAQWDKAIASNRVLAEHYPGFIITLEDLLSELNI
ncbi:tetratricopeptide tpr-2 [Leptolyngbya sp. Heron Island J]|uniref:tetratricopeptide repeat protein n=1 Tax=Leptolyngbya sp. Heron Island J TaxID=1385935 RepID=UPI0003B9D2F4|nr:tetratricopeptide repeat protein [Leptolyngbya sp. Heron Island J]ESA38800.1 tetratricopeptide tpr-2 [Leptolyngbya sp. Heron Island J]